jgi:hypothetical protein
MRQESHVPLIRKWLQSLGVLAAVSISRDEAEMKLAAYLPMLMSDFTDAAFTAESLHDVARQCVKGFPTYPELAAYLGDWWREHRPMPPQITVYQSDIMAAQRSADRATAESWDDPAGIVRLVRECDGNVLLLRTLGRAVKRWAPQHLGWIPPHILEMLDRNPDDFRVADSERGLQSAPANHLTLEELDVANPLPNGRKRAP